MHHHAHPARERVYGELARSGARKTLSLLPPSRCTSSFLPSVPVVPEAANATLIRGTRDPLSLMLCCGLDARSSTARRGISLALRARMRESESEPSKLLRFLARHKVHSERAAWPRACCSPIERNLSRGIFRRERERRLP